MDKESRFKSAIESNSDRIYRICCCYIQDVDERKDVFQDVLVRIWRSLDGFEGRSDVKTWVYRVTVNSCLGYLRSERSRNRIFDRSVDVNDVDLPGGTGESGPDGTDPDVERLTSCIARLPVVDRALVSLYLEELSTKEMAGVLGISEANVRVKLHRAKKVLKDMLEEEDHGTR